MLYRKRAKHLGPHAASSGLVASPNPIAAIPFARASGKDYFRTTIFFPANFVTLLAVIWLDGEHYFSAERIHQTTLNCNITPNISSILQRLFHGGITEAARQHDPSTWTLYGQSRVSIAGQGDQPGGPGNLHAGIETMILKAQLRWAGHVSGVFHPHYNVRGNNEKWTAKQPVHVQRLYDEYSSRSRTGDCFALQVTSSKNKPNNFNTHAWTHQECHASSFMEHTRVQGHISQGRPKKRYTRTAYGRPNTPWHLCKHPEAYTTDRNAWRAYINFENSQLRLNHHCRTTQKGLSSRFRGLYTIPMGLLPPSPAGASGIGLFSRAWSQQWNLHNTDIINIIETM